MDNLIKVLIRYGSELFLFSLKIEEWISIISMDIFS